MLITRLLNSLLIPLLLAGCGFWLINEPSLIPGVMIPVMAYLPLVAGAVVMLIAWQFNLFRIFTLSGLIIAWYLMTWFNGPTSSFTSETYLNWYAWLMPALLILISWLPERGILTPFGIGSWLLIIMLIVCAYLLMAQPLYLKLMHARLGSESTILWSALVATIVAIFHQLFRLWRYDNVLDGVLVVIIAVLAWFSFGTAEHQLSRITANLLIQILLVWGIIKHSHDMAYRDELTALPGRRALNEWMKAPGRKYVIAMMDIDHFKKFNDRYGHDVGDDVLKIVASRLNRVSGGGKAFRYGGEEFTIVFKGKDQHLCIPHLEAVREDIAHYAIRMREKASRPESSSQGKRQRGKGSGSKTLSVTISIGVAARTAERSPEDVIKAADKALYKAKKAGRNCLVADKN